MILLEVKSAKYEGATAKSRELGAYRTSGVYGKSAIIGPLMNELKSDNNKLCDWIPDVIKKHPGICSEAGLTYLQFDQIEQFLERNLE